MRLPSPVTRSLCLLILLSPVLGTILDAQPPPPTTSPAKIKFVVNVANPITALSRAEVAAIFTGSKRSWSATASGKDFARDQLPAQVQPVHLQRISPLRKQFEKLLPGRTATAPPPPSARVPPPGRPAPPTRTSEREILAFVKKNPGAIGYVAEGTDLVEGVKFVELKP